MILRSFEHTDIPAISEIWERHSKDSLPGRERVIIDAVVEKEGKVIAYGQLQSYAEAMLFMNLDLSRRTRRDAMSLLLGEAIRGAEQNRLDHIRILIDDPTYADLLCRHFGFERERPAEILRRRL